MNTGLGRILCISISAAVLGCSAACSLLPQAPYHESYVFDLGIPPKADMPFNVDIQQFSSECATKFKMLYRLENNQIQIDEYNRWTQTPGPMLTKYLRLAFRGTDNSKNFYVSGNIMAFEADVPTKVARLAVRYTIDDSLGDDKSSAKSISKTVIISVPYEENRPGSIAAAMAGTADKLVLLIRDDIADYSKEIPENRSDKK